MATGIGLVNKISKSPYLIINIIGNLIFVLGSILMIIGAAIWLAGLNNFSTFNSTTILWVIGSSLILVHFLQRNYACVVDGIYLYHSYMRSLTATATLKYPKGFLFSLYINGLSTLCYTVASILLLIGSIAWITYLRTGYLGFFLTEAGVLWIVSGSLFLVGGISQTVSRR